MIHTRNNMSKKTMEVSGREQVDSDCTKTVIPCDPCKSVDENQTAECFCTECNEYLCSDCTIAHRKLTSTKNHYLLGKDSMPKTKIPVTTEFHCDKHKDKPLDYFCTVHNSFYCTACITLEHRDCTVEYIQDLVDKFKRNKEYEKLCQKIKELDKLIDETKSETDRNVAISQHVSDNLVVSINQFRTEINELLDSLQIEILEKVKKIKDEDFELLSGISSKLDSMKTELDEMTTKMENLYEAKQNKKLVITSKLTQTKIDDLKKNIDDLSKTNTMRDFKFNPNEGLFEPMKSVKELGSITVDRKKQNAGKAKLTSEVRSTQKSTPNRNHVKLTLQRDIDVRLRGDQGGCDITGSVLMDNNRLAVVDWKNKCVKVIDIIQDSVLLHLKLDKYPWDITYTDQNQLVVTAAPFLVFLNVGKTLTVNNKLNVGRNCQGIDYTDNMLIVSSIDPSLVKFMNMDGQVMKSISTDMNGKSIFEYPRYIVTSRDKKAVYVTDCYQNTVTKLDMDGTVIDVYSSEDLNGAYGVIVDRYDNVYIAGLRSNNICVLTAGGRHIQPIIQVHGPQSVVVCDDSDQIIVSFYCTSSSQYVIRVYKIQRADTEL